MNFRRFCFRSSRQFVRVLACALGAASVLVTGTTSFAETPLEAYRRAFRANDMEIVSVPGWVTQFETPNVARLSISTQDLQNSGLNSQDLVRVTAGAQQLRARLITSAVFHQVNKPDSKSAPDIEADSYIIFDPAHSSELVRLVGMGSSLVDALKGTAGMRVEISLTRVRATPTAKIRSGG